MDRKLEEACRKKRLDEIEAAYKKHPREYMRKMVEPQTVAGGGLMRGDYCDKHRTSEVERCPICECHALQRQLAEARAEARRHREGVFMLMAGHVSADDAEAWQSLRDVGLDLHSMDDLKDVWEPPTEQPAEAGEEER